MCFYDSLGNDKTPSIDSNHSIVHNDDEDNTDFFSQTTRSGSKLDKLRILMQKFEDESFTFSKDGMLCILECGRKKSMLLLPCRHQHTCEQCWVIWKVEQLKKIDVEALDVYNDDIDDENIMKPKCPVCRAYVDEELSVFN